METPQFITFIHRQTSKRHYGLLRENGVVDLSARFGSRWATLDAVVQDNALAELAFEASGLSASYSVNDIIFTPPLTAPGKIICVGVNYPDRAQEYKDGQSDIPWPSLFVRFPDSFTGHQQPLVRPAESEQLDYEGEIALVIGMGGRRISSDDALQHIAALTLCNEGTVRDWVRHGKFNVTQGKNFWHSGSIGPGLVPVTQETQLANIQLTTRVNGELRQQDNTARMHFSFSQLIHYISTFIPLSPGDIIITGTPTGAGARQTPPVWLKPGDVIEITASGLGTLRNTVADEGELCKN